MKVRVENYKGLGTHFYPEWRGQYLFCPIWNPFYIQGNMVWFRTEQAAWDWLETAHLKNHKHNQQSTYSYKREGK